MKLLEQIVIKIIVIPLWVLSAFISLLQWVWGIVVDIAWAFGDRTVEFFHTLIEETKTAYDILRTYDKYTIPLFNRIRKKRSKK